MASAGSGSDGEEPTWNQFLTEVEKENIKEVLKLCKSMQTSVWDKTEKCPLELIVKLNKNKLLTAFIKRGYNVNKSFTPFLDTPLHVAIKNNNLAGIKILLKNGADLEKINACGYTPFMLGMENGNEQVVRYLLKKFWQWKNTEKLNLWVEILEQCPIHCLIKNDNKEMIQFTTRLLLGGVTPNMKNQNGNTPIMEVLYVRDSETAEKFIKNITPFNPTVNYTNKYGICPLFKVVDLDNPRLVKALIGIPSLNVNQVNMFRLTPIFYAVGNSHNMEVIRCLMKAGADPTITAAFTMRGSIRDVASAMLQAVVKGKITFLRIFYDFGFTPKRKWFLHRQFNSAAWHAAKQIALKTPTLKSLARKCIKLSLSKITKIPSNKSLESLELPKTLIEYISFQ